MTEISVAGVAEVRVHFQDGTRDWLGVFSDLLVVIRLHLLPQFANIGFLVEVSEQPWEFVQAGGIWRHRNVRSDGLEFWRSCGKQRKGNVLAKLRGWILGAMVSHEAL